MNPSAIFLMPILFQKHPNDCPQFRNAWLARKNEGEYEIHILTRLGQLYHDQGLGEEMYFNHPNFLRYEDKLITESFEDETYGHFFFSIPEEYRNDILEAHADAFDGVSDKFKELIISTYPNLNEMLIALFKASVQDLSNEKK